MKKLALFCHDSAAKPTPNGEGVNIRFWADLEALKQGGFDVVRVEFGELGDCNGHLNEYITLPPWPSQPKTNWFNYQVTNWWHPVSRSDSFFYPQYVGSPTQQFSRLITKYNPALVFIEHLGPMTSWVGIFSHKPCLVSIHDFDHILNLNKRIQRLKLRSSQQLKKPIALVRAQWQAYRHERYMISVLRSAASITTCGRTDAERLRENGLSARFIPVPVGKAPKAQHIKTIKTRLRPLRTHGKNTIKIVHVGSLNGSHNRKGLRMFLHESLPILRRLVFGYKYEIHLVGSLMDAPEDLLCCQEQQDVLFHGYVDDLGRELAEADFAIVPPGLSTGFRTKIPEAFAYGLPVVTGGHDAYAAGLEFDDKRVLIADRPDDFAVACARLIEDSDLRCHMGMIAFNTWEATYGSKKVIADTANWIQNALNKWTEESDNSG